jgi:hypothetical protein
MPTKGNPSYKYRRNPELHEQDLAAAAYFGETVTDVIIRGLDRNLTRHRKAEAVEQKRPAAGLDWADYEDRE